VRPEVIDMSQLYRRVAAMLLGPGMLEYLCAALLAVLAVMTFVNVIMRYFANAPVVGVDEIAVIMFAWITYLGALIAVKRGRHYSIPLIIDLLPPKLRAIGGVLTHVIVVAILGVTVYYAYKVDFVLRFQHTPALGIPAYYGYAALPIAGCGMILVTIIRAVEAIRVDLFGLPPVAPTATPTAIHDTL